MDRTVNLTLNDEKTLNNLGYCFTSNLRRKLIAEISRHSCTIMELAEKFNVPLSTMSTNIKILSDAGIILITKNTKKRGNEKIVSLATSWLHIQLACNPKESFSQKIVEIPIGSYTSFKIEKPCGIADEHRILFEDDKPDVFLFPERVHAQIIWFTSGYIEYSVPVCAFENHDLKSLTFSLELCSECPNYRNDWKSEITFSINRKEVATYLSPGDFGGRQGQLTPQYWSSASTQYGLLKNITINYIGTFIDGIQVSNVTLNDLKIMESPSLKFRIEVKKNSKYCGGINIFGKKFGDYPQDIILIAEYVI